MKKITKDQWMNQMEKFLAKKEEIEFNQFCDEKQINEKDRVNF